MSNWFYVSGNWKDPNRFPINHTFHDKTKWKVDRLPPHLMAHVKAACAVPEQGRLFENLVVPENLVKYGFIPFLPFEGDIVQKDYSQKRVRDYVDIENEGLDSSLFESLRAHLRTTNTRPNIEGGDITFNFLGTNAPFIVGSSSSNPFSTNRGTQVPFSTSKNTQDLVQPSNIFYPSNHAHAHVHCSGASPNHLQKLTECLARVVTPDMMQHWASWSPKKQYVEGVSMILMV